MKKLKTVCIFILCAAFVQGAAVVAFTRGGESIVFPLVRRVLAEKIIIGNNSYVEYYNIRDYIGQSDVIIIGADGRIGQTYSVLSDFLKYIKQNINVTVVALELGAAETAIINECISAKGDAEFSEKISALEGFGGMSMEFISFIESLYRMNRTMPPDSKVTALGVGLDSTASAICDVLDEILKPLYAELMGYYKSYVKTDKIDEFVDYFYEDAPSKTDIFGDSYVKVKEICDEYDAMRKTGKNTAEKILSILRDTLGENPQKRIFAVVLPERLETGGEMRTLTESMLPVSVVMTEFKYSNCIYEENGGKYACGNIFFPTLTNKFSVHLIRKSSSDKVAEYYRYVTGSQKPVNHDDFPFVFVISNGTETTPYSPEAPAVAETPAAQTNQTGQTSQNTEERTAGT